MQFVVFVGREALKRAPVIIRALVRESAKAAPVVFRPAAQFTRGVVAGTPKYIPIAGTQGARTVTITPFLRAGIQTRQATAYVLKKAVISGPITAARVFVRTATAPLRDAASAYYLASMGYGAIRWSRLVRGSGSLLERRLDAFIPLVSRKLATVGLEPRFVGVVATASRVPLYYAAYVGVRNAVDQAGGLSNYLDATIKNYAEANSDPLSGPVPVVPVPVVATPANVVGSAPVVVQPVRDNRPVPVAVPVPVSSRGAPVVYTPPVRR